MAISLAAFTSSSEAKSCPCTMRWLAMDLTAELSGLQQAQSTFEFRAETFLADLILLGLSVEVEESARAVQSLVATELPHRAFPLARTAYEAAQQALVLATHEDYAEIGTRAWVFFERRLASKGGAESKEDAAGELGRRIAEMNRVWTGFHPSASDVLWRAQLAVAKLPKKPDNWLGEYFTERHRLAYEMVFSARKMPPAEGIAEINKALFHVLSLETHATPRIHPRKVMVDKTGAIMVESLPRDLRSAGSNASMCAALSTHETTWALMWRSARALAEKL